MHTTDHSVEEVLKEARRFIVPLYQRKYQWDEERLNPFWEDVEAKASEVLNDESKFEHYMGALILSPVDIGSGIGRTPILQVVDGQQRLTTFQLFLAALREVARDHKLEDIIEHAEAYLKNEPKSKEKSDPLAQFKLAPTPSDRDLFHDIIRLNYSEVSEKYKELYRGDWIPKNTSSPALRAYWLFYVWIYDFCHFGPSDEWVEDDENIEDVDQVSDEDTEEETDPALVEERLEALLNAVLERLKLVVITLGENDDAQVIFETLNSKGKPLLAMDLVRNNVFHRAEKQKAEVEDLYKRLWDPLDDAWWREPAPNARPYRPRIDHFLGHVLAAETGETISMRELYAEYRDFAVPKGRPRFEDVEDELRLLESYAPLYETLEGRKSENPSLHWFGEKMRAWQVTTVYPVALQIGRADITEHETQKICEFLYAYIARRALCGLTTKNLNKTFQGLSSDFKKKGVSVATLKAFFETKDGDSNRFPDDAEFKRGIEENNAYRIAPRSRLVDILWELEKASRSHKAEKVSRPEGLWVEHVLPQTWTKQWPFPDGQEFIDHESSLPPAVMRRATLHTLGNLTLLTSALNQDVSNKEFATKRQKFDEHTGLFLNKWFKDREQWTEDDIRDRNIALANIAVTVWPIITT